MGRVVAFHVRGYGVGKFLGTDAGARPRWMYQTLSSTIGPILRCRLMPAPCSSCGSRNG